jgi:dCMP deaminase
MPMPDRPDWDTYFLSQCFLIAERSPDPDTKHGTIVVAPDHTPLSVGYNGYPRNCDDSMIPLTRPEKYAWMVHSEEAAICNASKHGMAALQGSTFYTTGCPCSRCARDIINAGAVALVHGPVESFCVDEAEKNLVRRMLASHNPPILLVEKNLDECDVVALMEKTIRRVQGEKQRK